MKGSEIRELNDAELLSRLDETKQEMFNLRFQLATGQLDNHRRLRQVKRDVARLRTVVRQREIAAAESVAAAGTDEENG